MPEAAVIREVTLQPKAGGRGSGKAALRYLRVYVTRGGYDLRVEDAAGNLRFSYQDCRAAWVLDEFERTLKELLDDYQELPPVLAAAAHG